MVTDDYLIECKMTKHKQYTLTLDTWHKIAREATAAGRTPMLELELDGVKLVVVSYGHFKELTDAED